MDKIHFKNRAIPTAYYINYDLSIYHIKWFKQKNRKLFTFFFHNIKITIMLLGFMFYYFLDNFQFNIF